MPKSKVLRFSTAFLNSNWNVMNLVSDGIFAYSHFSLQDNPKGCHIKLLYLSFSQFKRFVMLILFVKRNNIDTLFIWWRQTTNVTFSSNGFTRFRTSREQHASLESRWKIPSSGVCGKSKFKRVSGFSHSTEFLIKWIVICYSPIRQELLILPFQLK